MGKSTQSFAPTSLIFQLQQEVSKFDDICVSWSSPKTDLETKLLSLENRSFNPIQDGLFWGCSRMEGAFLAPLPKIRLTYPTMMKLGTVIPYLRKIQKMHKSRDTSLEFIFSSEISKFCYIKKYTYRLDFDT